MVALVPKVLEYVELSSENAHCDRLDNGGLGCTDCLRWCR